MNYENVFNIATCIVSVRLAGIRKQQSVIPTYPCQPAYHVTAKVVQNMSLLHWDWTRHTTYASALLPRDPTKNSFIVSILA